MHFAHAQHLRYHAYAVEAPREEGVAAAFAWAREELGITTEGNPDVVVLHYGLLGVEEARGVADTALQAPLTGKHKVIVIAAARAYREAQNALLKLFEEPPQGTYLFLILPSLGDLLPTLRSRVHVLPVAGAAMYGSAALTSVARVFLDATREKRSAIVKKLAAGRDEEERREHRDEALAIVTGIEAAAYENGVEKNQELLTELGVLRSYLHDRAAPVRMILEHLAIVTPRDLV